MSVQKRKYYALKMDTAPEEGARLLEQLQKYKVNLLALQAVPRERAVEVDLVPEDPDRLLAAEEHLPWQLSEDKFCFLVRGKHESSALVPALSALSRARIPVTGIQGTAAGTDRYDAIVWVRPADVPRATQVLGAT